MSSTQQALAWTTIGQGAIGLLAACRLQQAGYPVALWLKQPKTLDVRFESSAESWHCQFPVAKSPISQVFIAVKAYAVKACLMELQPHLSPHAQIVISHNGMPDLPFLQSIAQLDQGIWFLSTSHGALRTPTSVIHTGIGKSILSPLNAAARAAAEPITAALQHALGPVTYTLDIRPALWRKLAVNAAINPLTALNNCRNGALANPEFQPQISQIIAEVCLLANCEGIELELENTLNYVYEVIHATAANYSSMHQDVAQQRPLEIAAITGFILQTAARHKLTVPANYALWQAIEQKIAR